MLEIKGFITHALMAQNTPGQTAVIGELSTLSETYAREKGYYGAADAPEYLFTAFKSALDGTPQALSPDAIEHVLTVAKYVLDQTLNSTNQVYADQLLADLTNHFAGAGTNFQAGAIVNDGRYYAPEWLSWTSQVASLGANFIRLWFSDGSFQLQYDEYEIVVVPPLAPLDDFFKAGGTVQAEVTAKSTAQMLTDLQNAKQGSPETIVAIQTFNYIDPQLASHVVPTDWGLLIYGAAGNNIDSIKDAMVAYILANSAQPREAWTPLLPDLFKRTEFTLIPRWDHYAIPNRTLQAGINSPVSNLSEALTKAAAVIGSQYPTAHINSYAGVLAHPYKSLLVVAVGSPDNRNNAYQVTDVYPDYIAVGSTSLDFNRMSDDTKNWALLLEQLLIAAETVGPFTSVPLGMTKLTRNGILYVVQSYDNIHFLVAAKQSIDTSGS